MTEDEVEDFKCPSCGVALNVLISKEAYKDKPTENTNEAAKEVCEALPQDILPNLNVAVNKRDPKTIHIVPKKFLGKENWYKVSQAVKALRGEWVSQGRHSYWWVPTTQQTEV